MVTGGGGGGTFAVVGTLIIAGGGVVIIGGGSATGGDRAGGGVGCIGIIPAGLREGTFAIPDVTEFPTTLGVTLLVRPEPVLTAF